MYMWGLSPLNMVKTTVCIPKQLLTLIIRITVAIKFNRLKILPR